MVSFSAKNGAAVDNVCLTCPARPRMLCSGLSDEMLPALSTISSRITLKKGESLFYEGDDSEYVFNVVEGVIRLSRVGVDGRRQIMGFLNTGDYVGHTSRTQYTMSADALTEVRVCRFKRSEIENVLEEHPKFERQFHQLTAGLLDDMMDMLFTLGRKNARERVASFLVHQLERNCPTDAFANQVWLPMTRADIADFLGLTLETVSRAFSWLKKNDLIVIDQAHTIKVLDRSKLIEIAEGDQS